MLKNIGSARASLSAYIEKSKIQRAGFASCAVVFAALLSLTLVPVADRTDETEAAAGIYNPSTSSITVDMAQSTATVKLAVTDPSGTFSASSAENGVNFGVSTTNYSGYTLVMSTEDEGNLTNNDGATPYYLQPISSPITAAVFDTSANNNKWGIKPSKYVDPTTENIINNTGSDAKYFPASATTTLDNTTTANTTSNNYSLALGVRADFSAPSGIYRGSLNIYTVGNPITYVVSYNKNTTATVSNMPAAQTDSTDNGYIMLSSNIPTRNGYTFLGWCAYRPTTRLGVDSCGGTAYWPGDDYGLDFTSAVSDTLYAMWQSGSKTYIQDVTPETCPIVPTVVFDYRDEETYTIKKMPDGNCWMLDNLRIGSNEAITLTPQYTNIENNFTLPASISENFGSYTTAQINTNSKTKTAYYGEIGEGKIGTYYNFCAATAGTYCYGDGAATGNATADICPKGWHIPTGGESGEYRALYTQYNEDILFMDALRTPVAGQFGGNGASQVGTSGLYWSATLDNNDQMYSLSLNVTRSVAIPSDISSDRTTGANVRCIKDIPKRYMQDVADWKDDIGINESTLAIDRRDGKEYWVTKLTTDPEIPDNRADCTGTGNERVCTQLWMTQNLDFDIQAGVTYTHADTDLGWTDGDENTILVPSESTLTNQLDYVNSNTKAQSFIGTGRYYYTSGTSSNDPSYDLASCVEKGHTEYECRHYFTGNYYNYYAAAAMEATSNGDPVITVNAAAYSEMPNSVCPAGWKLPTGYTSEENPSDFIYLLWEHGITSEIQMGTNTSVGYTTDGFANLRTEPLWFVRAGGIAKGGLYNHYRNAYYWSNTIVNSSKAFGGMYATPTFVGSGGNADRHSGYSIRCVAREAVYLQDITLDTCPNLPTAVIDSRDGEQYVIQRQGDNCWMLENLRLDLADSDVQNNLTADTTNASNATLAYLKNGGGTTSDQYATAGVSDTWTTDSYSAPLIYTADKNTTGTGGYEDGKYGVYYNYCAATAGSYCYGDGANSGTSSGNVTEDICPKGWRLPTGDASGEYQTLFGEYYNMATYFQSGFRAPLSGIISGGTAVSQGTYGGYWSATRISNSNMYALRVDSASIDPHNGGPRTNGGSIRCTIGPDISSVTTMQEFGNLSVSQKTSVMNSMVEGQAYTLTDARADSNGDSEEYSIAKLADGNVWLLDNLRLDLTDTTVQSNLTSSTTNASDATLTYLKNGGGTTSDQYATAGVANWTSDYSYSAPLIATSGTDWTKDTPVSYAMGQSGTGNVGVYYNYCAATAGSYCYDIGTSAGTPSGNATEDICPKGWRMPTGGSSGEYQALYTAYSSDGAAFVNGLRSPLSGLFNYGSAYVQESSLGFFWSSTRSNNSYMYGLIFDTSAVDPQNSGSRSYGYSVRCILNQ